MNDLVKDGKQIKDNDTQKLYKLIPESLPNDIKHELKQSIQILVQQDAKLNRLNEYASKVNSNDIIAQYCGLNRLRTLLSKTNIAQRIESLIEMVLATNVHLKIFVIAKKNKIPLLKYEALWIICNIVYGTKQQIQIILDNDGIKILFSALESQYEEIIEQGIWALANIAGDNIEFRDMLLQKGIVSYLKKLWVQYKTTQSEIFKTIVWALSNLAKGKPTTKLCIHILIEILFDIIINTDNEEQLIDAIWGLSNLTLNFYEIHMQIDMRVINKLSLLLNSTKHTLIIPALKTIGNILTGTDEETYKVLQAGVLQSFEKLLKHKKKSIRREVIWSLSNIVAATIPQLKQVIKNDSLLQPLFKQLKQRNLEITKQIAFFISNSAIHAELTDLEYLIANYGFIEKLSLLLDQKDENVIQAILDGTYKLISKIQMEGKFLIYKQLIEDQKIIEKVIQLQNHPSEIICDIANNILDCLQPQDLS